MLALSTRSALPRLSTTVTFTEGVICDAAEEVLLGCVLKLIDNYSLR